MRRFHLTVAAFFVVLLGLWAVSTFAAALAAAPVLSVSGATLHWTPVEGATSYRVQETSPVRTQVYVKGTSYTPPPLSSGTATYRVKAHWPVKSEWSNEATINYGVEEPPVEEERTTGAGRVLYDMDASSNFTGSNEWLASHVARVKAYPPAGDTYLGSGLPVDGYHDAATEGFSPLTASSIQSYVSKVQRDIGVGYAGTFMDDINWGTGYRDGNQSHELEPEEAKEADLIEAVRAGNPTASIEINSQYHDIWPKIQSGDQNVLRALRVVNIVTKEFGVGPTSGISSPSDYASFFAYVDWLHAHGIHVVMTSDFNHKDAATMEYNTASYLLVTDGHDYVNGSNQGPSNWWPGFSANLGEATSGRVRAANGVWSRFFTGGRAYTLEPGASTQTIQLGQTMHRVNGEAVTSVTLESAHGVVLVP
jgi:hypothetical protein